ncbi:MAG: TonB-dependent receptor [Vicinamibacterales bacterium]
MRPRLLACLVLCLARAAAAQPATGELRIRALDDAGAAAGVDGVLEGQATSLHRTFRTEPAYPAVLKTVPFGVYRLELTRPGFAPYVATIDVRSEIPIEHVATMPLAPLTAAVSVSAASETLLDPYRSSAVTFVGAAQLRDRTVSSPGRSMIDLVNMQPGWLLESNGVLHARGSEYQVQYVVDGIPLRDNRSPAFAQSFAVDTMESMTIRTAGYPAEFGNKAGGVIEVTTARESRQGVHGSTAIEAGSHQMLNGYGTINYSRGGTAAGADVEGMMTDRFLDPPNEGNYTNHGSGGGAAGRLERAWTGGARTRVYGYRRTTRFQVPNEALQEEAGQVQDRSTAERLIQMSHQQVLSPRALLRVGAMTRDTAADLVSNANATPVSAAQDRGFRETYVNTSVAVHAGAHEFKAGGEVSFTNVREQFASTIVAREVDGVAIFDDDVPEAFEFADRQNGREQAVYVQDLMRFGALTVSAGLRFDSHRLVVAETAFSPRLSASWFVAPAGLVLHGSYDRTFETQPIENILLSSADLVDELGGEGRHLELRPSRGNFFEAGVSKSIRDRLRVDANYFVRRARNMTDDQLLLNTAVSFPIAFSRGTVTGFEAKVDVLRWGAAAGSIAYSLSKGTGVLPVSGGLFLGDDVEALFNEGEEFALSQDQRHTVRARLRTGVGSRAWLAGSLRFDSGLPVEIEGEANEELWIRQYGQDVVDRVDFESGRVKPSFGLDLSVGMKLTAAKRGGLSVQLDVANLANRLNVINFAGVLSGTAVGPRRTAAVRLRAEF